MANLAVTLRPVTNLPTRVKKAPELGILPTPTAMKSLEEAEMLAMMGAGIDDHLSARLESIAQDVSLPRATRARAFVALSRLG